MGTYEIVLREAARAARQDAAKLIAEAEEQARNLVEQARRHAAEYEQAAADMEAHANRKRAEAETCANCEGPLTHDGLGWKHVGPYTSCVADDRGAPVALAGPGETGPMPATQDGGPQE